MTAPLVPGFPEAAHIPRAERSTVRVVIALVVGCLALAGVFAVGCYVSSHRHTDASASNTQPYTVPSEAWADGAEQVWELSVAADAEVLTAGNHLVTIERDGEEDTSAALVGYEVSEDGATQVWSTTADLTYGLSAGVPFQLWDGSTLVHGATLIDLATGTVSPAPWWSTELALVVEDRVITCDSRPPFPCRAWAPGVETPVWAGINVSDASVLTQDVHRVPVLHRAGQRYIVVGNMVVNIDTGVPVILDLSSPVSQTVVSTAEGWAVVPTDSDNSSERVREFDIGGGSPVGFYAVTSPVPDGQVPLMGPDPLTREDLRTLLDGDGSSALGWATREDDSSSCFVNVRRGDGPTIDLPTSSVVRGNVISASSSCASEVIVSPDHDLVVVQEESRLTENAFAFLYDGATGTRIDFAGTDPLAGDTYSLVAEDLIVGYNAGTGTVYGYVPHGQW